MVVKVEVRSHVYPGRRIRNVMCRSCGRRLSKHDIRNTDRGIFVVCPSWFITYSELAEGA